MYPKLLSRRSVLRSVGAAAVIGVSGCSGGNGNGSGNGNGGGSGDPPPVPTIADGYTDRQSYRPEDEVVLYLNGTSAGSANLALNHYGGGSLYNFSADLFPQTPAGHLPWETGFGYLETTALKLPLDTPSGVYLLGDLVPVIVKADPNAAPADIVIVYPTNTMQAYNEAGGRSMYTTPRATTVSFLRPVGWISNVALFSAFLEWFAQPPVPYSLRYVADIDLENYAEIAGSKLLVLIGHSEYWTRSARENFDQFIASGGNALILSGNTMWWQVRYGGDGTQLICYKESPDPVSDPRLRTVNWTNPQLDYQTQVSLGTDFPHGGFGVDYPQSGTGFRVLSHQSPVFQGLYVPKGDLIDMPTLEYDGAPLLADSAGSGDPQLDLQALGAYRAELIGYEKCISNDSEGAAKGPPTKIATWIAYQRSATSGVIINGASTNWCSRSGAFGTDGFRVRKIILNMMDILVRGESPFSS